MHSIYFGIMLAIIAIVGSRVAYNYTKRQKRPQEFHFTIFDTTTKNYCKNGQTLQDLGRKGD